MADEYEYKDPNTDIMKALSKAVDAATGETGTQYEYKNPNTDVIQKLEELTEAIATSGGGSHNYSTDEQVVGTWIDGSTIYEKSFSVANIAYTTSGTYLEVGTISGANNIIEMVGVISNSAKTKMYNLPYISPTDNSKHTTLMFEFTADHASANSLVFHSTDTWNTSSLKVTIRYTKSTS